MSELRELAAARFRQSIEIPRRFFDAEAERISYACLAMARRFHRGGRLLAFGAGNAVTDAQHVSVEFVHPVIVGKRALPAIALGTDIAATLGLAARAGWSELYARQIAVLGRAKDIALGIDPTGDDPAVQAGLKAAAERGLLTIGLMGGMSRLKPPLQGSHLDFCFVVPSDDLAVIQETHETLYHVFWELVHVFFEHRELLDESPQDLTGLNADNSHVAQPNLSGLESGCTPGPDGRCAICSDEGVPGRVLEVRSGNMALVEMPTGPQEVALDLVEDVRVGDRLLIHVNVAIASLEARA
jgi:D-sedoheptulose 7-phosphate isomerase